MSDTPATIRRLYLTPKEQLRTQKSKGLVSNCWPNDHFHIQDIYHLPLNLTITQVIDFWYKITHSEAPKRSWFARPCPVVPQHGFVPSRLITHASQLIRVMQETHEADPEGEVLLAPYLLGKYSVVAGEHTATIGRGHDGVTSGTGRMVTVPTTLLGNFFQPHGSILGPLLGTPHVVELVTDNEQLHLVQFRKVAAATPSSEVPYLLGTTKAGTPRKLFRCHGKRVVYVSSSWLPDQVKHYPSHNVVFAVDSLHSHVACLLAERGVTVVNVQTAQHLARKNMQVTLKSSYQEDEILTHEYLKQLAQGIALGLSTQFASGAADKQADQLSNISLASQMATHYAKSGFALTMGDNATLRGVGYAALARLGCIASLAEFRYIEKNYHTRTIHMNLNSPAIREYMEHKNWFALTGISRQPLYEHYQTTDLWELAHKTRFAEKCFRKPVWSLNIGGVKWANIAKASVELLGLLYRFTKTPTRELFERLRSQANHASMLTHNGGAGALSKFTYITNLPSESQVRALYVWGTANAPALPAPHSSKDRRLPSPTDPILWPISPRSFQVNSGPVASENRYYRIPVWGSLWSGRAVIFIRAENLVTPPELDLPRMNTSWGLLIDSWDVISVISLPVTQSPTSIFPITDLVFLYQIPPGSSPLPSGIQLYSGNQLVATWTGYPFTSIQPLNRSLPIKRVKGLGTHPCPWPMPTILWSPITDSQEKLELSTGRK